MCELCMSQTAALGSRTLVFRVAHVHFSNPLATLDPPKSVDFIIIVLELQKVSPTVLNDKGTMVVALEVYRTQVASLGTNLHLKKITNM